MRRFELETLWNPLRNLDTDAHRNTDRSTSARVLDAAGVVGAVSDFDGLHNDEKTVENGKHDVVASYFRTPLRYDRDRTNRTIYKYNRVRAPTERTRESAVIATIYSPGSGFWNFRAAKFFTQVLLWKNRSCRRDKSLNPSYVHSGWWEQFFFFFQITTKTFTTRVLEKLKCFNTLHKKWEGGKIEKKKIKVIVNIIQIVYVVNFLKIHFLLITKSIRLINLSLETREKHS